MISNIILLQGGAKKKTKSCIDIIFVCDYNITNTKYVSSLFNSVMLKFRVRPLSILYFTSTTESHKH